MKSFYLLFSFTLILVSEAASQNARLQLIHNSADTSARYVDVYWNNTLLYNNFVFHRASAFFNRPGNTAAVISIADSSSTTSDEAFATFDFTPLPSVAYILILQGIKENIGYESYQPFGLKIIEGAREVGLDYATVDMLIVNGSTDNGVVDIVETSLIQVPFAEGLAYGQHQDYVSVFTGDYQFRIADAFEQFALGDYYAPFTQYGLNGKAVTIVTSGFSNQQSNSDGELLSMWMAKAEGGMMTQYASSQTAIKLVHNSPGASLNEIDVYWNGRKIIDNLPFRHSSAIVNRRLVNGEVTIGIAPAESQSSADIIFSTGFDPFANDTALFVLNGLAGAAGYSVYRPLTLTQIAYPYNAPTEANHVAIQYLNGATDAVGFDLNNATDLLVNNSLYGDVQNFEVAIQNQIWTMRNQQSTFEMMRFNAPFEMYNTSSVLLLTSGFIQPEDNNNGAEFGLWADVAMEGGPLVNLEQIEDEYASIQLMNNSSDQLASLLDVYVNDQLVAPNVGFNLTNNVQVKATVDIELKFVTAGQTLDQAFYSNTLVLNEGNSYFMLLDGMVSTLGYNPLPTLDVHVLENPLDQAQNDDEAEIMFYNGCTDIGALNMQESASNETLLQQLTFGNYATGYIALNAAEDLVVKLTSPMSQFLFGHYNIPFQSDDLAGEALLIFTHGFWNPANNSNGDPFTVWMLQTDGTLTQLESVDFVGVQDLSAKHGLLIYPVPAKNVISILHNGHVLNDATDYFIIDVNGKTVDQGKVRESIDISHLSAGMYSICVKQNTMRFLVE